MTNTKKKGERKERLAQKELEKEGWTTIFRAFTVKRGPFFVGVDFADLFDLVCVRLESMVGVVDQTPRCPTWKFVSVKAYHQGGSIAETREKIAEFAERYGLVNMEFEQFTWRKPGYYGRGKKKAWDPGGFVRERIF